MIKQFKELTYSNSIIIVLFLYISTVYFSKAISNISMGLAILIFIIGIASKKIEVRFDKQAKLNYLLIIVPFLLTVISVLISDDKSSGLEHIRRRLPLLIVPFVILFNKNKTLYGILIGAKIFVSLSVIATLISFYKALSLFIRQDVFLDPYFTKLITVIQHPYFGIYHLIAIILLIELRLYKNVKMLIILLVILSIGVVISTSRLTYLLAILIISVYSFRHLPKSFALLIIASIIGIVSLVVISNDSLRHKIVRTFDYDNSPRLWLWNNTYKVLINSEHPIVGVGIGDYYSEDKNAYYFRETNKGTMGYNPHNQYFEFLLTNGIFGSLFLASMIILYYRIKDYPLASNLIFLIIATFAFTECIFNRQFGVLLYSIFIPLLFTRLPFSKKEKS